MRGEDEYFQNTYKETYFSVILRGAEEWGKKGAIRGRGGTRGEEELRLTLFGNVYII